ncbi:hypothetical protein [Anditalea andensis]|uniref:TNase-like domain-containing protein n=1 Tax=Anditalea andensis TaxID=1048983 RepID=A0A074L6L4_9BACT|nr:hypothetical protein [Anditalea andensis]KEO75473.1 hypothetical protein EL17_01065 [Anditalea andensis]
MKNISKKAFGQIILFLLFINFQNCKVQESNQSLKIADFEFTSIFGINTNDYINQYCLLGSGYFRAPRSENSDSLIIDWLNIHPRARVVPVSTVKSSDSNGNNTNMVYCWVIDKEDTLNNYLIKNGAYPGETMVRPQTWDELETWKKATYQGRDKKANVEVYIDNKTYETFIEQIKTAELYARNKKLGIWEKALSE